MIFGLWLRLVLAASAVVLCGCSRPTPNESASGSVRIVSLGGAITETIFALGAGNRVVGTDSSSLVPDAAARLPKVGYVRQFSAEGVIGLEPTLVVASSAAAPASALAQVRAAGVQVIVVPEPADLDGARNQLQLIAEAVDAAEDAKAIAARIESDIERARQLAAEQPEEPRRVLFVYARGAGTLMVSGRKTGAEAMIELAGGRNAVGGFEGFRPLSAEAVVGAAPDVILIPARGLESLGGPDNLFRMPGLAETPAARSRSVIAVDDLALLGFGPRLGEAVLELATALRAVPTGEGV